MKPYPTGFHAPAQTLTRYRVTWDDGSSVVVMAADEDAALRQAAFHSFATVRMVERLP